MRSLGVSLVAMSAVVTLLAAAPAHAAPPTERQITDAAEPGKAYDILRVTMTAAPGEGRKAKIVVEHDRRVRVGDGIDMWFDTDADGLPDIYLTGFAFSEYAVYKARGWDGHGRDISGRGCAGLAMRRHTSVVRIDPSCLAPSTRLAISVRSFVQGRPDRTADQVPRPERLTRRISAYAA